MNNTLGKSSLLDEIWIQLRRLGYATATENSYFGWVRWDVKFHGFANRDEMLNDVSAEVEWFLADWAVALSTSKLGIKCINVLL